MSHFAIDYETYYDKDCSVDNGGIQNYMDHPDFEAYMVSVVDEARGLSYVGHPSEIPWAEFAGMVAVSHNRSFDEPVHRRLVETGVVPNVKFKDWHCTADAAAFHTLPRGLKHASGEGLGIAVAKEVRDGMKGKKFADLGEDAKAALYEYARMDSVLCSKLWAEFGPTWPGHERQLSRLTSEMAAKGVPVNEDKLKAQIAGLRDTVDRARDSLPWVGDGCRPLSAVEWGRWCREEMGVAPPASMDKSNDETLKWMADNPGAAEVLRATHTLRGANSLLKKFEKMVLSVRGGRLPYGLKYFGGHTGRDSGAGGFNMQNMPRGGLYGANMRECIEAGPGKTLVIADLSQIEPRVLAYLSGDHRMLDMARANPRWDWYEAQARSWGMWEGDAPLKSDPALRHQIKTQNLGCGFGLGKVGLSRASGEPLDTCARLVGTYRKNNPAVVKFWGTLERSIRGSLHGDYELELPSGRSMRYREVKVRNGLSAMLPRSGRMMRVKMWGGFLTENVTQAVARDVFMGGVLDMARAGHDIVLRVHDEVVVEVDESDAGDAAADIVARMTKPPEWWPDLPLAAEAEISKTYKK